MLINVKSTGGGGGGESRREEGGKSCKGGWQRSWHGAIHSVATPRLCARQRVYVTGAPSAGQTARESPGRLSRARSTRPAAPQQCQDYRAGSAASPSSDTRRGLPCQCRTTRTFCTFSPSNVILPQRSQHNGCFHTLRDKGRRLRHDTAAFRAEAGILESSKIKGKGK